MISESRIRAELSRTVAATDFSGLGAFERGKVRDSYKRDGQRLIVATDRISAFDCVLGTVPFKGQVLTQLAAFWFERTRGVAANHMLETPDPAVMLVAECEQLPIEFVVRGYITGVTKTSAWYNYERGVRDFCGNRLPEGLRKNQKLDKPIVTPTTKLEKHDRNVSRDEAVAEGLIDGDTFDEAAAVCLKLYDFGVKHAAARGLIFVDTKYELGRLGGRLVVTDEINTPDSSRYWFTDTYLERFAAGEEQRKLDKEYVREWLADRGFLGDGPPPRLTDEVRIEAARRYISAYELITGRDFTVGDEPPLARMSKALERFRQ
ncbi:MAG: phosphoribosylaminoimidazolesuccinocarboxamide synthase [Lentisphaerae bacterium]|nr:phosphoribosylaminoimidazolesuccinocarboxamide synthase [Lentisphaerota bacterium]